jgi:hypothetical protein
MKIEGSGSISQRHGSADPDPHQNVMDPQLKVNYLLIFLKILKSELYANFSQNTKKFIVCQFSSIYQKVNYMQIFLKILESELFANFPQNTTK